MHRYSVNNNKDHIIFFILAFVSIVAGYFLNKIDIRFDTRGLISIPSAFGCYGLLYKGYNELLWRIRSNKILGIPNINGNWKGIIKSDHNNSNFDFNLKIKQKWRKILIILNTDSSQSVSFSASILEDPYKLVFNYRNQPNYDSSETMKMHIGTCELFIENNVLTHGNYFNDRNRKTNGAMKEIKKI